MIISSTDLIAYLGAAAWVPQIIGWLNKLLTKPIITISPEKTVSIGYTNYGPIFNLRLSIDTDKKDALIDFIGVEIQHQNGSKHRFEWTGMTEFFSEVTNNQGGNQTIQRDIVPIAIKLSTLSLSERFFRFQDSMFIKTKKPFLDQLIEKQQFMSKDDSNYHDSFLKSKELEDYLKFMRTHFYWQAGNYTVNFHMRSPKKIKPTESYFKFNLTQDNIDRLNNNLDEIKTDLEYCLKKSELPNFTGKPVNWAWINSTLEKSITMQ